MRSSFSDERQQLGALFQCQLSAVALPQLDRARALGDRAMLEKGKAAGGHASHHPGATQNGSDMSAAHRMPRAGARSSSLTGSTP
jgi:hypothetical protein